MAKHEPMTLRKLERIVLRRIQSNDKGSYTLELVRDGKKKIAKKIAEEAVGVSLEVVDGNKHALVGEAADLFYHMIVGLAVSGVTLKQVYVELDRRDHRKIKARSSKRARRKKRQ